MPTDEEKKIEKQTHSSSIPWLIGVLLIIFSATSFVLGRSLTVEKEKVKKAQDEVLVLRTKIDGACISARVRSATMVYNLISIDSAPLAVGGAQELAGWMTLCPDQSARSKAIQDAVTPPRRDLSVLSQAIREFSRGE